MIPKDCKRLAEVDFPILVGRVSVGGDPVNPDYDQGHLSMTNGARHGVMLGSTSSVETASSRKNKRR